MSLLTQISELDTQGLSADEFKDKLMTLINQYPEIGAIGVDGYTVMPDSEHLLHIQVDTHRILMDIYADMKSYPKYFNKQYVKHELKTKAPWLLRFLPQWFTEETSDTPITNVLYAQLMQHLNEMSFKHPSIRSDFLVGKDLGVSSMLARIKYGLTVKLTTPTGTSDLILRLTGRQVQKVSDEVGITGYKQYVTRGDVKGNARKGFPRGAVEITVMPDISGGVIITTNHPSVTLTCKDKSVII